MAALAARFASRCNRFSTPVDGEIALCLPTVSAARLQSRRLRPKSISQRAAHLCEGKSSLPAARAWLPLHVRSASPVGSALESQSPLDCSIFGSLSVQCAAVVAAANLQVRRGRTTLCVQWSLPDSSAAVLACPATDLLKAGVAPETVGLT